MVNVSVKLGMSLERRLVGARRCGWFDAVVARYGVHLNGVDALVLTKVDVLDGFDTIKVCTGYKYKGKVFSDMPADPEVIANCDPVYVEFEGWSESTLGTDSYTHLTLPTKA